MTSCRGAAVELNDFSVSLPTGASLAVDFESAFVLLGDLLESVLDVSDLNDDVGAPDDAGSGDGNVVGGVLPVGGSGSVDFGAPKLELGVLGNVDVGGVDPGAVEPGAVAPGAVELRNAEPGVTGELASGGFNEGALELGAGGAWPIASAAIATSVKSMNVKRILRVTAFVSSVVFGRRCEGKARCSG